MNRLNRRRFLSIAAHSTGVLAASVWLPAFVPKGRTHGTSAPMQSLFVTIHPDNRIVFRLSKQEMGQGISTGYAMVFADELGADLERMEVMDADYDGAFPLPLQGITGGSSSMPIAWQALREAAAELRTRLVIAAGQYWQASPEGYTTLGSMVIDVKQNRRVPFGDLIQHVQTNQKVSPTLRPASDYQYIGKPLPSIRMGEIVSGRMRYGLDISLPGMVYAAIERCPVFLGKAAGIDDTIARRVSGVLDVLHIAGFRRDAKSEGLSPTYLYTVQDGFAVVATNSWAALQGRKALKIVWDGGKHANVNDQSVVAMLSDAESNTGRRVMNAQVNLAAHASGTGERGDEIAPQSNLSDLDAAAKPSAPENTAQAYRVVKASYDITFQAHALMEPLNTICHVTDGACEVWSGHQFPRRIVEQLSAVLSLPAEQITVHVLASGGGFGRRWEADFVVEAALISKQMKRPVKCFWTREDEIRHDYYHAYERHLDEVYLDNNGRVTLWNSKRLTFSEVWNDDAWNPYMDSVPSRSLLLVELESPLQLGPWRSVSPHRNTFSRECTIDRIATELGKDPLDFRLEWLRKEPLVPAGEAEPATWLNKAQETRVPLIRVLEKAKTLWPADRRGVGIAITTMSSTCAHIAHVKLVNGTPTLSKVDVIVYCGRVINPSLVKGQFEGSVIWALQAVLYGGIHLQNGRVVQSNFNNYRMVRMPEVPTINIHLMESDEAPLGVGEPGVPPLAPAMANAIYSLTGKQPTSIPFNW